MAPADPARQPCAYIVPPCTLAALMALLDNRAEYLRLAEIVVGDNAARGFYCFGMLAHYKPRVRQLVSGRRWEKFFASSHLIIADHIQFRLTARETLHHFCCLLFC